jgi:hypothetical protein
MTQRVAGLTRARQGISPVVQQGASRAAHQGASWVVRQGASPGFALLTVLILLGWMSGLAWLGMGQALLDERGSKQQMQILMAWQTAETGLLAAVAWWQDSAEGLRHDQHYWGDPERALAAMHRDLPGEPLPGFRWEMLDLVFTEDQVRMRCRGRQPGGGAERRLQATYERPPLVAMHSSGVDPADLAGRGRIRSWGESW